MPVILSGSEVARVLAVVLSYVRCDDGERHIPSVYVVTRNGPWGATFLNRFMVSSEGAVRVGLIRSASVKKSDRGLFWGRVA